jgi:hypothetical protein
VERNALRNGKRGHCTYRSKVEWPLFRFPYRPATTALNWNRLTVGQWDQLTDAFSGPSLGCYTASCSGLRWSDEQ